MPARLTLLVLLLGHAVPSIAGEALSQPASLIDEQVFARLDEAGIAPSGPVDDATFLRRLSLTTTGQLPTPAEVREFLADTTPNKRQRKIDERLVDPLHAAVWATKFSELTGNHPAALEGPDELKPKRAKMGHDWFRRQIAENRPYDELIAAILTATSRDDIPIDEWIEAEANIVTASRTGFDAPYADRESYDLLWRRDPVDGKYPTEEIAERIASSFLGIRINCAKCHDHPFDPWTQAEYRQFVALFAKVDFGMSPELRSHVTSRLAERRQRQGRGEDLGPAVPKVREVYLSTDRTVTEVPKPLGGPPITDGTGDPRVALSRWLREPDNPYFARNVVNRVWAHYFGRGIVEPLDSLSSRHEVAHAEMLDALARDFVAHGYDLRWLEREILTSRAWQLSAEPNDTNATDDTLYSRSYVRLPMPEVTIDMWTAAVGIEPDFGPDVPPGVRAVEIAPSRLGDSRWGPLLTLMNRNPRTETCDCAPAAGPSIRQTLSLMSDRHLLDDMGKSDFLSFAASHDDEPQVIDELYLRTLSRFPTGDERATLHEHIVGSDDRQQALADALWALVNSHEFLTIH